MGLRGPLRDPDSRRGKREGEREAEQVFFPDDSGSVEEIFQALTDQLTDAGLPLKQKDAHSIKAAATNIKALALTEAALERADLEAKDLVKLLSIQATLVRDTVKHLQAIGATTIATLRLVKAPPKTLDNPGEQAIDDIFKGS
jgi:HPt (histidine-containing phosphotransfer) domain-containing protein